MDSFLSSLRQRPRRLRRSSLLRDLVHETDLSLDHLIQGLFVAAGHGREEPIASMPGVMRRSVDRLLPHLRELVGLGIRHVILFGIPDHKGPLGHSADDVNGVVQQALRAIRDGGFNLTLVADACFCEYTDHGHCGVLAADRRDVVDNDATLERLQSLVVSLAEAGADAVAPSGMMDGTVAAVREALDRNNFSAVPILMYSAKYASAFYGPFREAAQGAPSFGDRRAYQMDPRNGREALVEAELDVAQGADIVMVKPALSYLDIIRRLRDRLNVPIAAYNVSGEYAMVKAASAAGMLDEQATVTEILTSIRRAGADAIVTYHAADFARWQQNS